MLVLIVYQHLSRGRIGVFLDLLGGISVEVRGLGSLHWVVVLVLGGGRAEPEDLVGATFGVVVAGHLFKHLLRWLVFMVVKFNLLRFLLGRAASLRTWDFTLFHFSFRLTAFVDLNQLELVGWNGLVVGWGRGEGWGGVESGFWLGAGINYIFEESVLIIINLSVHCYLLGGLLGPVAALLHFRIGQIGGTGLLRRVAGVWTGRCRWVGVMVLHD